MLNKLSSQQHRSANLQQNVPHSLHLVTQREAAIEEEKPEGGDRKGGQEGNNPCEKQVGFFRIFKEVSQFGEEGSEK